MTPSRPTRWLTLGAFALDVGGRTMACVLRSNREMRVLRVDIQTWLRGSQPQNPQEARLEEAIMKPHLPKGTRLPISSARPSPCASPQGWAGWLWQSATAESDTSSLST